MSCRGCLSAAATLTQGKANFHEFLMQPFWDVLWADIAGLWLSVCIMLMLSLPASALGVFLGARSLKSRGRGPWTLWDMACGTWIGIGLGLCVSMLIEFSLQAEGLSSARLAMREAALWHLYLA